MKIWLNEYLKSGLIFLLCIAFLIFMYIIYESQSGINVAREGKSFIPLFFASCSFIIGLWLIFSKTTKVIASILGITTVVAIGATIILYKYTVNRQAEISSNIPTNNIEIVEYNYYGDKVYGSFKNNYETKVREMELAVIYYRNGVQIHEIAKVVNVDIDPGSAKMINVDCYGAPSFNNNDVTYDLVVKCASTKSYVCNN